jgi:molybdopterin molybdotransferase
MISVQEAKAIIRRETPVLESITVPLPDGLHRILAEDVVSPLFLPLEDNSAMDGFALFSEDTRLANLDEPLTLKVAGVQRAGDDPRCELKRGRCIRIMTGATIPAGADAVVPKEKVREEGDQIQLTQRVPTGAHIRKKGEEIQIGEKVLRSGLRLRSQEIGLLGNLGLARIPVVRPPRVSLIVTGSELLAPPEKWRPGKIFDSNSPMLLAALKENHREPCWVRRVPDHYETLKSAIDEGIQRSDLTLVVGGVSVGDYDFSKKIFGELGVQTLFWRVAQKPGKPLYFGKSGQKLVFGLPGNPVSVWICFQEYVRLALWGLQGMSGEGRSVTQVQLGQKIQSTRGKTVFMRAEILPQGPGNWVAPLQAQGSHCLSSLSRADGILELPPGETDLQEGTAVNFNHLNRNGYDS